MVQAPDKDDYKKLTKVMQHPHCIKELTLAIKPGDSAQWWVDSSYTIHPDRHVQSQWYSYDARERSHVLNIM